jgi:hypothetical protein
MTERWWPIEGFEGYEVSNLGHVRSWLMPGRAYRLRDAPRLRKQVPDLRGGYMNVILRRDGKSTLKKVHRLVLEVFVGPCPPGHESRHMDGDPTNNKLENLKWSTHVDNTADQVTHGTHTMWARNGNAKLTEVQVEEIRRRLALYVPGQSIAAEFGVSRATISRIKHGIRYASV